MGIDVYIYGDEPRRGDNPSSGGSFAKPYRLPVDKPSMGGARLRKYNCPGLTEKEEQERRKIRGCMRETKRGPGKDDRTGICERGFARVSEGWCACLFGKDTLLG